MADNGRSISKRLIWMNLLVSATALLLACVAFIGYDLITFRQVDQILFSRMCEAIPGRSEFIPRSGRCQVHSVSVGARVANDLSNGLPRPGFASIQISNRIAWPRGPVDSSARTARDRHPGIHEEGVVTSNEALPSPADRYSVPPKMVRIRDTDLLTLPRRRIGFELWPGICSN